MHNTGEAKAGSVETAMRAAAHSTSASGWVRFVIPSVCDLVFVLLLLGLTWGPLAKWLLGDAGIGWHIRTGQLILSTHSVPRVDPFSSTMQGKTWYAWEWLYDAAVGAIHHVTGLNGVVFASALVIALTFALVLRRMLTGGVNLPVAVILLLLAVAASTIHFFARPHVLSWLFTVIWFGILVEFEADGGTQRLLWLPVLMLVWVNVHGGFVVGFVLLALYFAAALGEGLVPRNEDAGRPALLRAKALGLAGILSFVVTFLNPYGYKLHIHIYRYLTDRFLMDHIDEFLSPNFHGLAQRCFAGLVLLAVVGAGMARRKLAASELLLTLFAIYSGLYAARNIPVSSMLLALILAPQISGWVTGTAESAEVGEGPRGAMARLDRFGRRMLGFDSGLRGSLWTVLVVLLGLWACGHQGHLGPLQVLEARFDDTRFPVRATDFLEHSRSRGALFCPDRWGGYLIYRLYPQERVAVDDRHDFYGAEFLKRYLKIVRGEDGWETALEEMHPDWVMVPANSALASLLAESHLWTNAFQDDTAVLFRRGPS